MTERHIESINPARESSLFCDLYIEWLITDEQRTGKSATRGENILQQVALSLGLSPKILAENYPEPKV